MKRDRRTSISALDRPAMVRWEEASSAAYPFMVETARRHEYAGRHGRTRMGSHPGARAGRPRRHARGRADERARPRTRAGPSRRARGHRGGRGARCGGAVRSGGAVAARIRWCPVGDLGGQCHRFVPARAAHVLRDRRVAAAALCPAVPRRWGARGFTTFSTYASRPGRCWPMGGWAARSATSSGHWCWPSLLWWPGRSWDERLPGREGRGRDPRARGDRRCHGALLRYVADLAVQRWHGGRFPWGTLAVNVLGSLLLGVVLGMAASGSASAEVLTLVGTGFCGR